MSPGRQCQSNEGMKKRSEEMQILRTSCSKAEPKIFAPPQTPFLGARGGQNLISWRWSLPLPTNPVWWGSMHAILSHRSNRPTHMRKQTGPITIHCTAASVQCNKALDTTNHKQKETLLVKSSPPKYQHMAVCRPVALPVTRSTVSERW